LVPDLAILAVESETVTFVPAARGSAALH